MCDNIRKISGETGNACSSLRQSAPWEIREPESRHGIVYEHTWNGRLGMKFITLSEIVLDKLNDDNKHLINNLEIKTKSAQRKALLVKLIN